MENSVQYIGVDNLYWCLCYNILLFIINIKTVVKQASVLCISIRRKRADFGPNTFQSSSVVANQRHVVFVVKNHDSRFLNAERVLQVFTDGRHISFDNLFVYSRAWFQRPSGKIHHDARIGRPGKIKLLSGS